MTITIQGLTWGAGIWLAVACICGPILGRIIAAGSREVEPPIDYEGGYAGGQTTPVTDAHKTSRSAA